MLPFRQAQGGFRSVQTDSPLQTAFSRGQEGQGKFLIFLGFFYCGVRSGMCYNDNPVECILSSLRDALLKNVRDK